MRGSIPRARRKPDCFVATAPRNGESESRPPPVVEIAKLAHNGIGAEAFNDRQGVTYMRKIALVRGQAERQTHWQYKNRMR
jgi:hypothetical protein